MNVPTKDPGQPSANEQVADFSEGCFWHAEIVFKSLVGVRDAVSGYAGGNELHPDYEKVCTGTTGHAETVQVYYDPSKISFTTLVEAFFASVDPTQLNRQGNDIGTQYRSIIFYRNAEEKKIIDDEIAKLTAAHKFSGKIVTEVKPFKSFYPAEDLPSGLYQKPPRQPLCSKRLHSRIPGIPQNLQRSLQTEFITTTQSHNPTHNYCSHPTRCHAWRQERSH